MTEIQLHFANKDGWRAWLAEHHDSVDELWMVFFKKHTGRANISYDEAVEEALCFGWIDSLIKRLDDDRYARKFTPRKDVRRWSEANLKRVDRLVEEGRMTEHGLAKVPADVRAQPSVGQRTLQVPPFFAEALAERPAAREFFAGLAPSYRRDFIHWVSSAKREETRQRRLREAINTLEAGKKLGMK